MPSPQPSYRRTVALATLGLGTVLGSMAFTSQMPGRLRGPFVADITCGEFLQYGMEKETGLDDNDNHRVKVYRTRSYTDHITKFPKWIGGVKLGDRTSPNTYPGLAPNSRGCLYFNTTGAEGDAIYAQLFNEAGSKVHEYTGKFLCVVPPHNSSARPEWKTAPKNCRTRKLSISTPTGEYVTDWTVSEDEAGNEKFFASEQKEREIESALRDKKLPDEKIKSLLAAARAGGPWFPCALTGCCRAFE